MGRGHSLMTPGHSPARTRHHLMMRGRNLPLSPMNGRERGPGGEGLTRVTTENLQVTPRIVTEERARGMPEGTSPAPNPKLEMEAARQ
jgi:hypothetical protein